MNLFIFIVPLAALAAIYYRLHNHLRAFFKQAQERCKKPGNEQFDTGESFDAYYNEIARRLGLGTILFIYTGHLFVWLCLVSFPWESHIPGEVMLVIIAFMAFHTLAQFGKAISAAHKWIELEARGMQWVVMRSGAQYRLLWFFSDTKILYDDASRYKRLVQEHDGRVQRRKQITNLSWTVGILLATCAAAFVIIEHGPGLTFLFWVLYLFAILPFGVALAGAILDEEVFRSNAQFIPGANVLDAPPPPKQGRLAVETQDLYGKIGGFAAVKEALAALGPPPSVLEADIQAMTGLGATRGLKAPLADKMPSTVAPPRHD